MSDLKTCDWCGKNFRSENAVYGDGGLFSEIRCYCSRRCKEEGEASNKQHKQEEEEEWQNMGFFGRLWRIIKIIIGFIVGLLILVYFLNQ